MEKEQCGFPVRRCGRWLKGATSAVLVVSLALFAASSAQSERSADTLKVGATLDFPPFAFIDAKNKPTGMEVEMVQAMGQKLGYNIDFKSVPYSQIYLGLAAKKYDLIGAAVIFITCPRLKGANGALQFTVPFYSDDIAIAGPKAKLKSIKSFADMKGLTVSVGEKGSTADSLASAFLKKHPGYFKVVRYSNTTDTAVALQQGRVDVVVGDHVAYAYALRNRSDFGVGATIEGSVVPVGLPFRPGDKRIAQFNKAINQLKRNGTIAKIYKKWVGTAPAANNAAAKVVPPVTAKTCFKI